MSASSASKAAPLDGFFHYKERGGTFGGEIGAGVLMGLLAVCGVFMNTQLVAQLSMSGAYVDASAAQVSANGEVFAAFYFISMMASFAATLVVGLATRLPLVQVTSVGLSVVLVSILGTATGLTYYNLLFVTFVSSLAFLAVSVVPQLRSLVVDSLPAAVRKALPVAMGLMLAWMAAQLTGLFSVGDSSMPIYGTNSVVGGAQSVQLSQVDSLSGFSYSVDKFHPLLLLCALSVLVAFVVYLVFRLRLKHPCLTALLAGTLFFLVASVLLTNINWKMMKLTYDSLWGRAWMVGAEDAMQAHLSGAIGAISVGKIFSEGLDFSAYTAAGGNVALLIASGILTFLFLNVYGTVGCVDALAAERGKLAEPARRQTGVALLAGAAVNVVAPLVGVPPMACGPESVAGVKDRGRSGLSSVVAAAIMLVSAFVWLVPALLATVTSYTISFNMYGHYGKVMQLLSQCSFSVADAVMVVVGVSMAVHSLEVNVKSVPEAAPFAVTVAGSLLTSNLALGVAAGVVTSVLVQLLPRRKGGKKTATAEGTGLLERVGGAGTLVWAVVSLALIALSLF